MCAPPFVENPAAGGYQLYGSEASYFTGKVRAYLHYKRIPFTEYPNSPENYRTVIMPRVGWRVIPVVVTPEGETLQDSSDIIDALEIRYSNAPVYPATTRQRLTALLLAVYGDEWLKLPAMHYRWAKNYDFIISEFGRMAAPQLTGEAQREVALAVAKPFAGSLPFLGVTPATQAAIEKSYEALLGELDRHFAAHDYLLGTRPSIGDFGLIGPLYAHLYRDPASGELMKRVAPNAAHWVERMMAPPHPREGDFLARDEVPATLVPVLQRMMREMLPVLVSTAHHFESWVAGHPDAGTASGEIPRTIGMHDFLIEGVKEKRAIFPFDLWMLQRPLDFIARLEPDQRLSAAALLAELGGESLMEFPAFPRLTRRNFRLALA